MVDSLSIEDELSFLCGRPVWKPSRTHGSMFFLESGRPYRRPQDVRDHGEWSFLFEHAYWHFSRNSDIIVTSNSKTEEIDRYFSEFELTGLKRSSVDVATGALRIDMENAVTLIATSDMSQESTLDDQWLLYTPSGDIWVAKANGITRELAQK